MKKNEAQTAQAPQRPEHFEYPVEDTVLEVVNLSKRFVAKHRSADGSHSHPVIRAVDGISFQLRKGEILGIVGESGCGKTTTGKMIMRLLEPTSGAISFEGKVLEAENQAALKEYRRKVQMIFQDPYASMNPRFRIQDVLEEPLLIHKAGENRAERMQMVKEVLGKVKITPAEDYMSRHPHMLSGGQRQRIATARTLILSPKVIVADEPVSMIDLSTRAEILHMMKAVQHDMGLSILYITHDISTARFFTNRLVVMYLGAIVEIGPTGNLIDKPAHPYTQALIAAVCEPDAGKQNSPKEVPIKGEIPSAANIPKGCRFHPRCVKAFDLCSLAEPGLYKVDDHHHAACWLHAPAAERQKAEETHKDAIRALQAG